MRNRTNSRWERDPSILALVLMLPLLIGLKLWLNYLGTDLDHAIAPGVHVPDAADGLKKSDFIGVAILASTIGPVVEEFVFRFIPMILLLLRSNKQSPSGLAVAAVVLISSIGFGLAHGSVANLPVQGVSGILYSLVFLKWSGWLEYPLKGWAASTLLHAGYNCVAFLIEWHTNY